MKQLFLKKMVTRRWTNLIHQSILPLGLCLTMSLSLSITTYASGKPDVVQQAKGQKITGVVVDDMGETIIGATVVEKGTNNGTITDMDGKFSLNVSAKAILVISYVGMEPLEVKTEGKQHLNLEMKVASTMLNEVVAIGYGVVNRKDISGSVVSVSTEDISRVPVSDISQALAGRVSGVMVTRNEGEPGAGVSIRVRGGMSITQNNEPLYIIDGFPTESGLSSLDPADIESIDILKDASSTAVYGARGANGVVVVTTKKGDKNGSKFSISYDTYLGVAKLAKKLDVLSPYEYAFLDYERRNFSNEDIELGNTSSYSNIYGKFSELDNLYANRKGVDWQEETLGGNKLTQSHRISAAGGNKNTNYNMSYAYFDEEGLMLKSGYTKHNVKLRVDHRADEKWTFSGSVNFDHSAVKGIGTSGAQAGFNKLGSILTYRPTAGILGEDSKLLLGEDPMFEDDDKDAMQNPILSALGEQMKREMRTIQLNGSIGYEFFKGLTFKNTTGARYFTRRNDTFYGSLSQNAKRTSINGSIRNIEQGSFQTTNTLTYSGKKGKHRYTALLGQEYVTRWNRWFEASSSNFPNDDIGIDDMSLGTTPGVPASFVNGDDKLLSFFTRLNYTFDDKYIVTATMRADGSSVFSKANKWGYFPSASVAWRLAEENFIKNMEVFSDLKLRVGYGLAGNNRIGNYGSLAILGSVTYPNGQGTANGFASRQIPNADLKWEANKTLNVGLDIGFFNQRLMITPEFYVNKSSNLLLNTKIPNSSGFDTMMQNIGETENMGIDVTIMSVNVETKDFRWTTNLNLSHNKNKVVSLANGQDFFLEEARFGWNLNNYKVEVGKPLGRMYGWKTEGLYQVSDFNFDPATQKYTLKDGIAQLGNVPAQPGYWKFANVDDSNNVIDDNDRTIIGDANPYLYGGMNNTFTYRNFDFSVFFTFSLGGDILNATKLANTLTGRKNYTTLAIADMQNRWVTIDNEGHKVTNPEQLSQMNEGKTVASYANMQDGDKYLHSWAVEDGSFLRLDNISLGYTFSNAFLKKTNFIKRLRVYATAHNLHTFTNYSGYDPEVSTMGNGMTRGVDWGGYPRTRSFVFGANVTF